MTRPTDDEISHAASCCGTIGANMIRRLHAELLSVTADRDERSAQKCRLLDEIGVMQRERNELKEAIRYWSYCTAAGMMAYCPEKRHELSDLFVSMGIAPTLETKGETPSVEPTPARWRVLSVGWGEDDTGEATTTVTVRGEIGSVRNGDEIIYVRAKE